MTMKISLMVYHISFVLYLLTTSHFFLIETSQSVWNVSPRGAGFLFGSEAVQKVC